jgi:hypothetical protein
MTRLSVAEYRALRSTPRRTKYGNVRAECDGTRFDSRLELRRYQELKALRQADVIRWFILQAPFRLPGGITYRADFLIVWQDGRVTVEDCKGVRTRVSTNKIKQVEALYGIRIDIISKERYRNGRSHIV